MVVVGWWLWLVWEEFWILDSGFVRLSLALGRIGPPAAAVERGYAARGGGMGGASRRLPSGNSALPGGAARGDGGGRDGRDIWDVRDGWDGWAGL